MDATFQTMEAKLLGVIMNPAMVVVFLLGGALAWYDGRPWWLGVSAFGLDVDHGFRSPGAWCMAALPGPRPQVSGGGPPRPEPSASGG